MNAYSVYVVVEGGTLGEADRQRLTEHITAFEPRYSDGVRLTQVYLPCPEPVEEP